MQQSNSDPISGQKGDHHQLNKLALLERRINPAGQHPFDIPRDLPTIRRLGSVENSGPCVQSSHSKQFYSQSDSELEVRTPLGHLEGGHPNKKRKLEEQVDGQTHQRLEVGNGATGSAERPGSSRPADCPVASPFLGDKVSGGRLAPKSTSKLAPKGQKNINQYFPLVDGNSRDSDPYQHRQPAFDVVELHDDDEGSGQVGENSGVLRTLLEQHRKALMDKEMAWREKQSEVDTLQHQLNSCTKREASLSKELEELQRSYRELEQAYEAQVKKSQERDEVVKREVCRLCRALAEAEGELTRIKVAATSSRLGSLTLQRTGPMGLSEMWEDGQVFQELARKRLAIETQKEEIEAARKVIKRQMQPPPRASGPASTPTRQPRHSGGGSGNSQDDKSPPPGAEGPIGQDKRNNDNAHNVDCVSRDEILKARLACLKREEELLNREEERLTLEKYRLVRLVKLLRDEDTSRFNEHAVLNRRYVLMNMLGKGGFSEVYKAYDVQEMTVVACKIHQLNSQWNDFKKQSYVKYAIREYEIHKQLRHPHIVSLRDIFEIDNNTFATVLELCEGKDLDSHLREHQVLPEREARAILSQIFSGLAYLNQPGHRVIHYDLKPANILFNKLGEVKITDFGLSKVVGEGQTLGMELTSPGAGTYWYLPPECFDISQSSLPKISNKVDVWSAGVILYQMLYGRRPFGEGMAQEQILQDRVMLNARQVDFPSKPAVSAEAKEFIRKCLTYKQVDRWDVLTAAADSYLTLKRGKDG